MRRTRRSFLAAAIAGPGTVLTLPAVTRGAEASLEGEYAARFGDRRPEPGGFELDVARVVENGNSVALRVAADPADPPTAVHLFMPRNPERWGASFRFGADALPEIATRVRLSMTQNLTAVAAWPDGRLRSRSASVLVTLGACIDENFERWVRAGPTRPEGAEDAARLARGDAGRGDPGAGIASARVRVPETASVGERVEVRTLARHPMETGYRIDTRGARVPRNVIERFRCSVGGETVLEAELRPAIAADPYLAFAFRARRSGEVQLEWHEDRGAVLVERRPFEVTEPS
ncbi:MAG: thiosulfate oxidation carrier complex protein SoxZ [Pseudomonadales bacterium]|nr:thiosulfate oxidation carrier complex protein SoxZ [Pseudomonadales bacterium]